MLTCGLQLYDMDAKLVDARRPKVDKPTNAHKEERLIPYKPDVRCSSTHLCLCGVRDDEDA
jgi:ER membrane protein complex subunit 1, C-terminal